MIALNATTQNSQNSFDKDMCIDEAEIIFDDICIEQIVFSAYKVYDSNNVLIKSVESRIANPDEWPEILDNTLNDYCYIYIMKELLDSEDKKHRVSFNIDGGAGNYDLTFSFSKSAVKWDEYYGIAWYEDEKWKKKT